MNANVSANDGSERLREHNMVTSPAVEIFCNDCGGRAPQALSFRKARLNRFSRCSPREQNPGYSKYHWWNSEVNTCRELSFRHREFSHCFHRQER